MNKTCARCKEDKTFDCFHKNKYTKDGLQHYCVECAKIHGSLTKAQRSVYHKNYDKIHARRRLETSQNRRLGEREQTLLEQAKHRAKSKNLPFNITVEDIVIPTVCPVLGISIEVSVGKGRTGLSPSLDRIIPERGYVKGNIAVMSDRANSLKNNGSAEEHRKIASWIDNNAPEVAA